MPAKSVWPVEFAGTHPGGERDPLGRGEYQGLAGGVLGVPDSTRAAGKIRDLDALALVAAAARLSPYDGRTVIHRDASLRL
jgi:hypothetical protein